MNSLRDLWEDKPFSASNDFNMPFCQQRSCHALFDSMDSTREVLKTIVLENLDKEDPCISLKEYVDSNYGEQSLLAEIDQTSIMIEYKNYKKQISSKRQKTRNKYGKYIKNVEKVQCLRMKILYIR